MIKEFLTPEILEQYGRTLPIQQNNSREQGQESSTSVDVRMLSLSTAETTAEPALPAPPSIVLPPCTAAGDRTNVESSMNIPTSVNKEPQGPTYLSLMLGPNNTT